MVEFQEITRFSNLVDLFWYRVTQSRNNASLWFKKAGRYQFLTWSEFGENVQQAGLALYLNGVQKGDRVGILSENRPEWAYADLGTLSLGALSVPIYPTSSVKECHYILDHAEINILFVSTLQQLEKVEPLLHQGKLKKIICFDLGQSNQPGLYGFRQWLETGRCATLNNSEIYQQLYRRVKREDVATLIYTSGTTGPPKGVMLTHENFLSNCAASRIALPLKKEMSISFLPLSHVFERMAGYYYMIQEGVSIAYAENMQTVPEDLLLVRPTVCCAVPRFFEKMHARILETIQSGSPLKKAIFRWALKVGRETCSRETAHRPVPLRLSFSHALADLLVFKKLRARLGGRMRFFISGGAPLGQELAEFFYSAGVLILEGYGLTETSPVISVNRPERFKFGTVGLPLPGVEVRIADDGEILTKGPHIMKGYYKNEEATREVIRDGWFCTGDIGEIDAGGFLKITGRKKDLIITAGGKNISPQNIECEILKDPLFAQAVLIGDKRPYLVALLVPNRTELEQMLSQEKIRYPTWEEALRSDRVCQLIEKRLQERMRDLAPYEQIKHFRLLPKEFSQDSGELTPTLKVKRRVVTERYSSLIEEMYRSGVVHAR